ncbi:hypothetical protein AVEN_128144-1 [Araneus ventricosus]|uniref:Uncharacterized protein n=1 Tax=Araneus ventricosus TaxID=182803 RepID=A0A4Y1ZZQ9_ARAVE|nr:hypothetical protein AVEN_128144-1 [Araneus ventricosus]
MLKCETGAICHLAVNEDTEELLKVCEKVPIYRLNTGTNRMSLSMLAIAAVMWTFKSAMGVGHGGTYNRSSSNPTVTVLSLSAERPTECCDYMSLRCAPMFNGHHHFEDPHNSCY